jgi:DNA polymerase elongation subunit (family B)
MKIPLAVIPSEDHLIIYRNGVAEKVLLPFKPFALVEKDKFPFCEGQSEKWTKVPEGEEKEYLRMEFNTTAGLNEFKKKHADKIKYMLMNSYSEQLFISYEDFLLKYPHTNNLVVMFFDIEVATKGDGFFPRPVSNEILCIGFSVWCYKPNGEKTKMYQSICKGFDTITCSDKEVIDSFFKEIEKWDPDIIAGYNSAEFDFPYLIERAEIIQVDTKRISRDKKRAPILKDGDVFIPGRIHFDIYNSNSGVTKDQTLFGIKSRTLKELGRWYKAKRLINIDGTWQESEMEDIELPDEIYNLLDLFKRDPDRLYAYQDDDVFRTECVGHVYMRNCITLAEMMRVPLNNIINMYSSFVPKLFVARNMEKLRLISTESNFNKYNLQNGSIAQVGTKYEGALVGLYQDGLFEQVYKLDFKSMYPSSIQTWNLGPDTTKLIRVEEYSGKYECKVENKYNWYRIPTKFEKGKYAYDFIVRVRNDIDGFLKKEISRLKEERVKIKKEMKACSSEEKDALYSQQNAIKVILNSIYGLLGLKSSKYGEMISAVMVTSMCRWTTGKVIRRFKNELVELDTDGLILNRKVNEEEVNPWLTQVIKDRFNIDDNYMEMELEEFGRAYFYRMKNYIVEEENKKGQMEHIIHGSSLKGSKVARIVDRAVKLGIEWIFNDKPVEEVIREAYNFNLPIEHFIERVNLSQETREYDDQEDWRVFLAEQVKMKTGQVIGEGNQMSYVVTKTQLPFPEFKKFYRTGRNYTFIGYITSIEELDFSYYEDLVTKTLEKFGISRERQMTLDLFSGNSCEKRPLNREKLNTVPEGDI